MEVSKDPPSVLPAHAINGNSKMSVEKPALNFPNFQRMHSGIVKEPKSLEPTSLEPMPEPSTADDSRGSER